ncbi:hypothetical protein Tco_1312452 [Tanacetum coccineum]
MVFKGRFFSSSSSKKGTSSPESSNSPRSTNSNSNSNSPIRLVPENKKKTAPKPSSGPRKPQPEGPAVSPILASSLGLNRIKTRSGPLPQESFLGFGGGSGNGKSNLSKAKNGNDKKKTVVDNVDGVNKSGSLLLGRSPLRNGESSSSEAGRIKSRGYSGNLRSSELCTPEMKVIFFRRCSSISFIVTLPALDNFNSVRLVIETLAYAFVDII